MSVSSPHPSLQKHASGILNVLLHLHQELHSFPAVQQSVVVGESQVHHRADLNLAVDGNGSLLDGMETKNGTLGEVDDRGTHERAKNATVADGESTTGHILDGQLVVTSLAHELVTVRHFMDGAIVLLTFLPKSAMDFSMVIMSMFSTLRTTGVTSPFSVATATLIST